MCGAVWCVIGVRKEGRKEGKERKGNEAKRNETKRSEAKRNETKRKRERKKERTKERQLQLQLWGELQSWSELLCVTWRATMRALHAHETLIARLSMRNGKHLFCVCVCVCVVLFCFGVVSCWSSNDVMHMPPPTIEYLQLSLVWPLAWLANASLVLPYVPCRRNPFPADWRWRNVWGWQAGCHQ